MTETIYNICLYAFEKLSVLSAFFNKKAKLWVTGRRTSLERIKTSGIPQKQRLWFHCASLGEFEQGRPIIEAIKKAFPQIQIYQTFFSPSGYELRKDDELLDFVAYLPLDTKRNARLFTEAIDPVMAVFIKNELWFNYLKQLHSRKIRTILVSSVIHPDFLMVRFAKGFFKRTLNYFDQIFVQDRLSMETLQKLQVDTELLLSGDTRIDRVLSIKSKATQINEIQDFIRDSNVLICGSTWLEDERMILSLLKNADFTGWTLILAPHDISEKRIQQVEQLFSNSVRYSQLNRDKNKSKILIIDNIGMLSQLYQYANIAYIGGGFGSWIHNTLEPAAFNIPIIFGPRYSRFNEAQQMVEGGGAFSFSKEEELNAIFLQLQDSQSYMNACNSVQKFIESNKGTTQEIVKHISEYLNSL